MKKLILSTTFLIAGTVAVLAQGLFQLSNAPWEAWPETTPPDRLIYLGSIATANAIADPTFTAALYEHQAAGWVKVGDSVPFFGPGLEGIIADDGVKRNVTVSGAGGVKNVKISIFDATGTELLPAVQGANEFSFTNPNNSPPGAADPLPINLRAFAVVVPEPSTIALGVLGLGALLLFRRRK